MKKALILVDLQNDFCTGGALEVRSGEETVAVANRVLEAVPFDLVVATQDWHPPTHGSFAVNHPGKEVYSLGELDGLPQVMWPAHCVQGTKGAEFYPTLRMDLVGRVVQKGTDPKADSYSGFLDNGKKKDTGLNALLASEGITDLYILGLATDYCVKFTALDAVEFGYKTHLIVDGCRGVNMNPEDSDKAINEMHRAGVEILRSEGL